MRQIEILVPPTSRAPYGLVHDFPIPTRMRAHEVFEAHRGEVMERYRRHLARSDATKPGSGAGSTNNKRDDGKKMFDHAGKLDFEAVLGALQTEGQIRIQDSEDGREGSSNGDASGDAETWGVDMEALLKAQSELRDVQGQIVQISIAHDGEYVVASALSPVGSFVPGSIHVPDAEPEPEFETVQGMAEGADGAVQTRPERAVRRVGNDAKGFTTRTFKFGARG